MKVHLNVVRVTGFYAVIFHIPVLRFTFLTCGDVFPYSIGMNTYHDGMCAVSKFLTLKKQYCDAGLFGFTDVFRHDFPVYIWFTKIANKHKKRQLTENADLVFLSLKTEGISSHKNNNHLLWEQEAAGSNPATPTN